MFFGISMLMSCGSDDVEPIDAEVEVVVETEVVTGVEVTQVPVIPQYLLSEIDLNNWKVTLPIGNPTSVRPPDILDYATNATLKPFFYNDSIDGSLVFYTYPASSTPNSSYSRTELREQMVQEVTIPIGRLLRVDACEVCYQFQKLLLMKMETNTV